MKITLFPSKDNKCVRIEEKENLYPKVILDKQCKIYRISMEKKKLIILTTNLTTIIAKMWSQLKLIQTKTKITKEENQQKRTRMVFTNQPRPKNKGLEFQLESNTFRISNQKTGVVNKLNLCCAKSLNCHLGLHKNLWIE